LRDRGLLYDILISSRLVVQYIEGLTRDMFENDTKTQDAVIRRIEIIGEAAKRLTSAALVELPAIDWVAMRGMRDHIVHRYWEVDLEKVWSTARNDVPSLIRALEGFLLA
jgi:uncharacterized protein with HEPN domain